MILGVYFAFSSGTVDSIVYDTVVEETGSNELYEKWIGRTRAVESAAFVLSALAGGVLAQYTSERFTYFATVPLVGLAVIGFLRFKEPRLHQAADRVSLRSHIALTFRTMITSRIVLRVLLLVATAGLLSQAVFEFGPLWLVALAAPAVLYGPYWAALVSTLGVAGLLIGKLNLERRLLLAILIILVVGRGAVADLDPLAGGPRGGSGSARAGLGDHRNPCQPAVARCGAILDQGRRVLRRRDTDVGAVPALFAGVWLGSAGERRLLVRIHAGRRRRGRRDAARHQRPGQPRVAPVEVAATAKEEAVEVTQAAEELACKQLVELVADYLDDALSPEMRARFEEHLAGCDGCTTYLSQTQQIIAELRDSRRRLMVERVRGCGSGGRWVW